MRMVPGADLLGPRTSLSTSCLLDSSASVPQTVCDAPKPLDRTTIMKKSGPLLPPAQATSNCSMTGPPGRSLGSVHSAGPPGNARQCLFGSTSARIAPWNKKPGSAR